MQLDNPTAMLSHGPTGTDVPKHPAVAETGPERLPFGPYAGEDVASVAVIDPGYLLDLVHEGIGPAALRAEAARALAARGRLGPRAADRDVGGNTIGNTAGGSDEPPRNPPPLSGRPPPWALALALGLVGVVAALLWSDRDVPAGAGERVPIAEARAPGGAGGTIPRGAGGAPIARSPTAAEPAAVKTAPATPTAGPAGTPLPCGARVPGAIPGAVAGDFVDTFQTVEFEVVRTKDTGKVTFLNSHEPYQGHFYVAIFPTDYDLYPEPPALWFRGKCIVVQGTIELYRGVPQMVLRSPDDVRVVEGPGGAGERHPSGDPDAAVEDRLGDDPSTDAEAPDRTSGEPGAYATGNDRTSDDPIALPRAVATAARHPPSSASE